MFREWGRWADIVNHRDGEAVELKEVPGCRRGMFLLGLRGRRGDLREIFYVLLVGAASEDIGWA